MAGFLFNAETEHTLHMRERVPSENRNPQIRREDFATKNISDAKGRAAF